MSILLSNLAQYRRHTHSAAQSSRYQDMVLDHDNVNMKYVQCKVILFSKQMCCKILVVQLCGLNKVGHFALDPPEVLQASSHIGHLHLDIVQLFSAGVHLPVHPFQHILHPVRGVLPHLRLGIPLLLLLSKMVPKCITQVSNMEKVSDRYYLNSQTLFVVKHIPARLTSSAPMLPNMSCL